MGRPAALAQAQLRALDRLTTVPGIDRYYLAGGTAVAWHLRHRRSADLDLFSVDADADPMAVAAAVEGARLLGGTDAAAHLTVGTVPVDVVRYPYPLLEPTVPGPRSFPVAGLRDLAAMKLVAVAKPGIRRDFWDLHAIGQAGIPLAEALDAYRTRYGRSASDSYHVLRALTYFEDAERDPVLPRGLTRQHWSEVRAWCVEHVRRLALP